MATKAWSSLHAGTAAIYRQARCPGTAIDDPEASLPLLGDEEAFANFVVVRTVVERIEWLKLDAPLHRRAVWRWDGERFAGAWVGP
ncbi:MAG: hypothetical protein ACFCUN_12135 [Hyphomicrobiaceae bacterium]